MVDGKAPEKELPEMFSINQARKARDVKGGALKLVAIQVQVEQLGKAVEIGRQRAAELIP